jgi:AraC family transcriptional regulator
VANTSDWQVKAIRCSELPAQIGAALCTLEGDSRGECELTMPRDAYTISILLSDTHVCLDADAQRVIDASLEAGSCYVSRPGESLRLICPRGYKALHLRIPSELLWFKTGAQDACAALTGRSIGPVKNPLLLQLARALADIVDDNQDTPFAQQIIGMLVDGIRRLRAENATAARLSRKTTLPNWRLQRVNEYVNAHLSETVSLADMASAAGLSPMHFAAQFRAATGYRPHHYLLLCRLERAKELMNNDSLSMLDIALEVGFHTQAHFTTVFKRMTGKTPSVWRDKVQEARMSMTA